MKKTAYIITFLLSFYLTNIFSQENNLVIKNFPLLKDSIQIDTAFIDYSSVLIIYETDTLNKNKYLLKNNYLYIDTILKNAQVIYRKFSFPFDSVYYNRKLIYDAWKQNYFLNFPDKKSEQSWELISSDRLNKSGSISRGIIFGNNRNLSVNSDFNLQIDGQLSDNLFVKAVITDNNIPIQPEGNTAQLQDFDKIYIQLYNDQIDVTFGDFPFKRQQPHYLKLYKKTQGVGGTYSTKKNKTLNTIGFTAGLSRGKFARNIIQGIEGNQGPYRLKGANNENFIIILSGTERVYIDGKLLQRGQEHDYIIDYNTAELTFTAKQLITKDKRIVVEFQYSDRNYVRSLFRFSNDWQTSKNILRFDLYSEQDVKNQPLNQDLTEEQKKLLSQIGDSLHKAIVPGYRLTEYSDDKLLYKMEIDTLSGDTIFVYSTHPDSARYQVNFSYAGSGMGDYILWKSTANGKIFRYAGKNAGEYLPLSYLYTPKQQQVASLGGIYSINKNSKLEYEAAVSNNDINTFSKKDSQDDTGLATYLAYSNKKPISDSAKWTLTSKLFLETLTENFAGIDRFRPPEFFRNWNLRGVKIQEKQLYSGVNFSLSDEQSNKISTAFHTYLTPEAYQGYQNHTAANIHHRFLQFSTINYLTKTTGNIVRSFFVRNKSDIRITAFPWLTPGWNNDFESNKIYHPQTDSLQINSYEFLEWQAFLSTKDTSQNNFRIAYINRIDKSLKNNKMKNATIGRTWQLESNIVSIKNHRLTIKNSYRVLEIADSALTNQKADSTLLSRLEYSANAWKGAIRTHIFYEAGSGMEIKKDFTFIEVPTGQGVYVFNDYNDNGLKELNEFEVAAFKDQANYIKVFTPTNEFVKVFNNQYSQNLMLMPRIVWHNQKGWKKILAKFQDQFSIQRSIKHLSRTLSDRFFGFYKTLNDSVLQSQTFLMRNIFSFNKANPVFGIDVNYLFQGNKVLLVNGFTENNLQKQGVRIRWNISGDWLLLAEGNRGYKELRSDFLLNKNYWYNFSEISPSLSFQPTTKFRITLKYSYQEKINLPDFGNEKAFITRLGTEAKWNSSQKGNLTLTADFYNISYNASAGTAIAYDMLQGLNPGYNIVWQAFYQKNVAKNLQISINYNGRASPGAKVIHTGGVQARAFF